MLCIPEIGLDIHFVSFPVIYSIRQFAKTPVTPEQLRIASKKKAERQGARIMIASSNALASPVDAVGSHRALNGGAHFEHAHNKRCLLL